MDVGNHPQVRFGYYEDMGYAYHCLRCEARATQHGILKRMNCDEMLALKKAQL